MNNRDDWDRHWNELKLVTPSNPAQAFRREIILHWLARQAPSKGGHVLDIGSGQGDLLADLSQLFPDLKLAGVELSASGIAQARAKAPRAEFHQRNLSVAPVKDDPLTDWAQWAICSEVLEHVEEPAKVLAHGARFLKSGACIFITVPGGPMSAFDRHIGHRQHFNQESLGALIRSAGLIPEKVHGVGFPFFNLYKLTVILRGKALIHDVAGEELRQLGWMTHTAMRGFLLVLKRAVNSPSRGWQMVAQARKP